MDSYMIPVIGILAEIDDNKRVGLAHIYTEVIEKVGALPLILPYVAKEENIQRFIDLCDGFLFSGGADVQPNIYGEEVEPFCGETKPYRDALEVAVLKKAIQSKKPILCICRGMQLLNAVLGGTLYQDIKSQFESNVIHRQSEAESYLTHEVSVLAGTPLHELVGVDRMVANTYHHQAIKTLADDLKVMATADDGIIEAVYYKGENYIHGYQWHPERRFDCDVHNQVIFENFMKNCKKN